MKILVVDDSVTMRRIIVSYLKSAGYEDVVEAGNGVEAISNLSGIELILTDWNMPIMDGLTMVKEIRENEQMAELPIIMITTEGAMEEVLTALKHGVNDYVVKPFTKQVLMQKINGVIGK